MFENIGWIVEGKIKAGQREAFDAVMKDLVEATSKEEDTLNYQYYLSKDGADVFIYERFKDIEAAHTHVGTWDRYAERFIAAADCTRMVHLGDLPPELRERHAALDPLLVVPYGGFAR